MRLWNKSHADLLRYLRQVRSLKQQQQISAELARRDAEQIPQIICHCDLPIWDEKDKTKIEFHGKECYRIPPQDYSLLV